MDIKFKNNIIYYKLTGGVIKYLTQKSNETRIMNEIQSKINKKKTECTKTDETLIETCKIDPKKINNISYFLTYIIPNCNNHNIQLSDIKSGRIIGKGAFGYSFLVKSIIIKIVICNNHNDRLKELDMHKKISILNNPYFIKLYGYYMRDENKIYKYHYLENNTYITQNCNISKSINDKIIKFDMCEKYLILEAGKMDIKNYVLDIKTKNVNIQHIIKLFFDLIKNFYKISEKLIQNNEIFIHSDIKLENMVIVQNKKLNYSIKLIDFGASHITKNFYQPITGTIDLYEYLFVVKGTKPYGFSSPLIDIFLTIICMLQSLNMLNHNKWDVEPSKYDIIKHKINTNLQIYEKLILLGDYIYLFYNAMILHANYLFLQIENLEDIHEIKINEYILHGTNKIDIYKEIIKIKYFSIANIKLLTLTYKDNKNNSKKIISNITLYNEDNKNDIVKNIGDSNFNTEHINYIIKLYKKLHEDTKIHELTYVSKSELSLKDDYTHIDNIIQKLLFI